MYSNVFRGREVAESYVRATLVIIAPPGFVRHSSRSVPLKVSMKALSGAVPRRKKSIRAP